MTPRSLPDPGKPPTPVKTVSRWDSFIGELATGVGIEAAMKKFYVTRADIETMTRLSDGGLQRQRFEDARLAGRKSSWSMFDLEDFFALISQGITVEAAHERVKGSIPTDGFYHLLNAEPDMNARYKKAKEGAMLHMAEHILEHADDSTGDVIETLKGPAPNMANVGRSKLKVDSRFRLMGSFNARLFGEKKGDTNVQVNINPAERLEEARARVAGRDKPLVKPISHEVVDAVFAAVPAADTDVSWMDAAPTDTIWKEEK